MMADGRTMVLVVDVNCTDGTLKSTLVIVVPFVEACAEGCVNQIVAYFVVHSSYTDLLEE